MMFRIPVLLVCLVTSPAFTAVVQEDASACSADQFSCGDGQCVRLDQLCDGLRDCYNGADEAPCLQPGTLDRNFDVALRRSRRQAKKCRKSQWQCRDGTCIGFDGKCDGMVDCPDGSDETHPLCRKNQCQQNWFRCTYGACVDGTAPCNGIQECADNSDELLPKCRNETESKSKFRCANNEVISAASLCDGAVDCTDGSDETVRACAAKTCPSYLFQCAYGACVDQGADCDGNKDCADGSDESDELCNRISSGTTTSTIRPSQAGNCVLPPYPDHGTYTMAGAPAAGPGSRFDTAYINITCNPGYGVLGKSALQCYNGFWSDDVPKCVHYCKLNPHPSVEYKCLITGSNAEQGSRNCNTYEPSDTIVQPECKRPNYYYAGVLTLMRCIDGSWDYIATCNPGLVKNGTNITILVKDEVEIHISNFLYASPTKEVVTKKPSITEPVDFNDEIDEGDWRIGSVTPVTPVTSGYYIKHDRISVNASNAVIHFED